MLWIAVSRDEEKIYDAFSEVFLYFCLLRYLVLCLLAILLFFCRVDTNIAGVIHMEPKAQSTSFHDLLLLRG